MASLSTGAWRLLHCNTRYMGIQRSLLLILIEAIYLPAVMAGAEMSRKNLLIFGYPLGTEILGIRATLGKTAARLGIHGRNDLTPYDALNFLSMD